MDANKLLNLLQTDYKTATVMFDVGQPYRFKADKALPLEPNDYVVCDTARGFALGKVCSVVDAALLQGDDSHAWKWVVQKVDLSAHEARKAKEAEFADALKSVELLRKQDEALKAYRNSLPEGSEARTVFENAVGLLRAAPPLAPPVVLPVPGASMWPYDAPPEVAVSRAPALDDVPSAAR